MPVGLRAQVQRVSRRQLLLVQSFFRVNRISCGILSQINQDTSFVFQQRTAHPLHTEAILFAWGQCIGALQTLPKIIERLRRIELAFDFSYLHLDNYQSALRANQAGGQTQCADGKITVFLVSGESVWKIVQTFTSGVA